MDLDSELDPPEFNMGYNPRKKYLRNAEIRRLREQEKLTLVEIGKRFDLTKQRISVILKTHNASESNPNVD
jgi:hypothetical protein